MPPTGSAIRSAGGSRHERAEGLHLPALQETLRLDLGDEHARQGDVQEQRPPAQADRQATPAMVESGAKTIIWRTLKIVVDSGSYKV